MSNMLIGLGILHRIFLSLWAGTYVQVYWAYSELCHGEAGEINEIYRLPLIQNLIVD